MLISDGRHSYFLNITKNRNRMLPLNGPRLISTIYAGLCFAEAPCL
jgi:hypothetical protein